MTISQRRQTVGSAIIATLTLVLWVGCLAIGVTGLMLPYVRPHPPVKETPSVTAEVLTVELTSDPIPPPIPTPPQANLTPPPLAPAVAVPTLPPQILVAAPSPQIAFAVPIAAPAQIVPTSQASFRTVEKVTEAPPTPAAAQPLIFGQGEGKQPAPEYPYQALRQGQEGVVVVRMTVGENGRVLAAEASTPSPWSSLNDAALRVVKTRWHFTPGVVRNYEVAIRFQLNK